MNLITYIRLVNRVLIKEAESPRHRLYYMYKIINISEKYGICISAGTDGGYIDGPMILSIYKRPEAVLEVKDFYQYLKDISDYTDVYQGVQAYTKMEFKIGYSLNRDGVTIVDDKTDFAVWLDPETDKTVYRALTKHDSPIIPVKPRNQYRITDEQIQTARREGFMFKGGTARQMAMDVSPV